MKLISILTAFLLSGCFKSTDEKRLELKALFTCEKACAPHVVEKGFLPHQCVCNLQMVTK